MEQKDTVIFNAPALLPPHPRQKFLPNTKAEKVVHWIFKILLLLFFFFCLAPSP